MRPLKSFVGFWGSAVALQPAVAFLVAENAAAFYSINEWFEEWGKRSYMKGHIPRMATSEICFALQPDLQWE
eukprot:14829402-Alexandrium_andersonii.AAC.1